MNLVGVIVERTVHRLETFWAPHLRINFDTKLFIVLQDLFPQFGIIDIDQTALVVELAEEWIMSPVLYGFKRQFHVEDVAIVCTDDFVPVPGCGKWARVLRSVNKLYMCFRVLLDQVVGSGDTEDSSPDDQV